MESKTVKAKKISADEVLDKIEDHISESTEYTNFGLSISERKLFRDWIEAYKDQAVKEAMENYRSELQREIEVKKLCKVKSCGKPKFCKGYCSKHYRRVKRTGSPIIHKI